jgi:phage-related minor tail protein
MARKIEDALLAKKITDQGVINTAIQQATANIDLLATRTQRFTEIQKTLDGISNGVAKTFETTGNKIFDAFARGETGALKFKDILREVFIDIQKMLFQVLVMDRITKAIREGISGSGSLSKFIGSMFIKGGATTATEGSFASGGTVQANRPSLVGERGPELFVPGSAGVIKNNADTRSMMGGGGGGVNITQNLNFALGVTNTVRSEIANMLPTIQQSTISAVADAKLRGGKFAKAFGG